MKDIFDFKRFGKYFTYDLKQAWDNFGLSLIILGCMPLIVTIGMEILSLVGHDHSLTPIYPHTAWVSFGISAVILMLIFPVKTYGKLTSKKEGSDWLMIPASTTEKFVSMMIIICLVLPAAFLALTVASNAILSIFADDFGSIFPTTLFNGKLGDFLNMKSVSATNWIVSIMAFTLGAICFKKGKTGKTLLAIMGIGIIVSMIVMLFLGNTAFDNDTFEELMGRFEPEKAQRLLNSVLNIYYALTLVILGGGIFYRIKTLKH